MSTLALNPKSDDAFKNVLAELNDIATQIRQMIVPLDSLRRAIHEASQVILKIEQLFKVVDEVCLVIDVTQKASCLLSGVPIISEIAAVVAKVLTEADKIVDNIRNDLHPIRDKLPKIQEIFQKADNGIGKIYNTLNTIAEKIPEYVHTIAISDCLFKIAKPLLSLLKGTDGFSGLSKFVKEYENIRDQVSEKLLPIIEGIDELVKTINKFENNLNNICGIGTSLDGSISGISSITDELNRITKALHKVEEAIDPVKWALKAAKDVEKVVNPVLKATGLEHMVDSLKDKIFGDLEIGGVLQQIEQAIQHDFLPQADGSFDGRASNLENIWNGLDAVLSQHSTGGNGNKNTVIQALLTEIAGTPVDFTKPGVILDWAD